MNFTDFMKDALLLRLLAAILFTSLFMFFLITSKVIDLVSKKKRNNLTVDCSDRTKYDENCKELKSA